VPIYKLRRLEADLVLYYKCLHNLSALRSDAYILLSYTLEF